MNHIAMQISSLCAKILQPHQNFVQHIVRYSNKIREAGKAKENVHFLKQQRAQLKELQKKIALKKDEIKKKINNLDSQIEEIKKKNRREKKKEEDQN
ncbi:uncharacterized protein LOC132788477 isoform X1 [Drosophila nasuta]|uniref:uncharacterized protein LOC132788477 isoform X1 n=1 Tax=Drosophila nasuta TaxID=42062 RepID=UPI00295E5B5F|nr:uncharacterized protein LOC132788477 isoform X1 [Drosophila nasuta]